MKNVFFSILVLFMLAVSMIGNVDIAKAESNNILVGDRTYNPTIAIKGINNFVDVTFRVTNIDQNNALDLAITATAPVSGQNSLVAADPEDIQDLGANGGSQDVTFRVTNINQNTVAGIYTGTIRVQETQDNFKEVQYSINVQDSNPAVSASGLTNNEIVITSEEENVKTKEFTLTNSGNRNLNDLTLKIEGGTFSDGTETISFRAKFGNDVFRNVVLGTPLVMESDLNVGSSSAVVIEATIPQNINLDNYVGRIVIADTTLTQATVTIPLTIRIEPEICSDGRVANGVIVDGPKSGNGLRIDSIDSPDNNDDFRINDEISIEVTIENKESKDMDVIVEAVLYDLDRNNKILTVESDSAEIEKDGEKVDFDFIMTVPNDEDIDPDNTYILYIKGYEDGDEDQYCNYDSVEVDLERDDDAIIMTSFTINPTVALQESTVSFRVGVENVGTDDQRDTYIVVRNEELGLDLRSNVFDLKKYDKSGNDRVETFTFAIPDDAEAKDYTIETVVYYNNERDTASSFGTLKVQDNGQQEETVTPTTPTTGAGTYNPTGNSIFSNMDSTKTLFIIGDIILVILAILFLILIFKKK